MIICELILAVLLLGVLYCVCQEKEEYKPSERRG